MSGRCRIELLGGLRVLQAGRVVDRFRTHKTAGLLAYLAFHLQRSHPRELLIELLWPESDPRAGRDSLITALSSLRRQLEPPISTEPKSGPVILATREAVSLNPAVVSTDVMEFEQALRASRSAAPTEARAQLQRAVELYRGELLPGRYDLSEPTNSGARVEPGWEFTVWAKFEAPAEGTKKVSFIIPGAPPFEDLPIAGTGEAGMGQEVAGAVIGLDQRLTELGAKVTESEVRVALEADVLFDFDKADLKQQAEASLMKVADVLRSYPESQVIIEGYTDAKGSDEYNQALSEKRAAAVRTWLAARKGLGKVQFVTRGLGELRPVAPNAKEDGSDDPEGRRKNRRVEIIIRTPPRANE